MSNNEENKRKQEVMELLEDAKNSILDAQSKEDPSYLTYAVMSLVRVIELTQLEGQEVTPKKKGSIS